MTERKQEILDFIKEKKQVTVTDLVSVFALSKQSIHRHLNYLMLSGAITKIGSAPRVYYLPATKQGIEAHITNKLVQSIVEKNYFIITPAGEQLTGEQGFAWWCKRQKLPLDKTAREYTHTVQKYEQLRKNGWLDATHKLKSTFDHVALDKLYYLDFYSIERFGKTRLGQLVLYSKQSQNRKIIHDLILEITPSILKLAKEKQIDAVGFIPPTVRRGIQIMKECERFILSNLPHITLRKVHTDLAVPQKTLSKLSDRIENAATSIMVDATHAYKKILLIDDAVGSGATLNETARMLRERGIATGQVYGLSIVGSLKGFDVISEV